jgi:fermentation-respiration switch protein FrsA (DUF1100 family)
MLTLLLGVAASLAMISGWLFVQQPAMLFHPSRALDADPQDWGLHYENVQLTTADGFALNGWFIPRDGAERVVLFLHGNAGNISHRGDSIQIFHRLGLAVFIFDYRGYGRSQGSPDEKGFYRDADAAWRYLVETRGVAPKNIVIFGRSLGGAVAAHLAGQVQPGGLILESTLSSTRDFARLLYPLLSRVVVMRYRFDTVASLADVHCPVLVLHSPEDDIMPYSLGEAVYRSAREPRQFVRLRGDHNSGFLRSQPAYEQALGAFFATLPAGRGG